MNRLLLALTLSLAALTAEAASSVVLVTVDGSDCELCINLAQSSLRKLPGVKDVLVEPKRHLIAIETDGTRTLEFEAVALLVTRSGYAVRNVRPTEQTLAELKAPRSQPFWR